jgi:Nucleotidyl transferase AbiEii toxin, Type IV TA system
LPSPTLVEKNWRIVQALAAIVAAETTPLRLVFGGGTALSRAHRLIRRMSEDIGRRQPSVDLGHVSSITLFSLELGAGA